VDPNEAGHYYPADYYAGHFLGGFDIRQKTGTTQIDPAPTALTAQTVTFRDAAGANSVAFAMQLTASERSEAFNWDVGTESRSYQMIRPSSGTAPLVIT
jgi:hypothetical protein